jgi:hypothetical protein
MADANLTVGVEVELRPDENTCRWLESLGWVRPEAPSSEAVETEAEESDDWDPAEMLGGVTLSDLVPDLEIPEARPLRTGRGRAMGGSEAMRYRAARLRRDLMTEVSSPERVDEMLRNLDIDPEALPDPDCDC